MEDAMPRRSPNASRPIDARKDAALDAAFPASDPVAILQPALTRAALPLSRKKDIQP
ncbi:hypothetical protein GCM10007859_11240 [Brevundimonas denitrificans]|uniref:Uncharacterized protein n=2 Tax=Brevundimonas denitrificans TaxID=1443434 RepID=A0ABQ6BMK8_9CAUL|nr:hypothetical protein GCM10007859_11240 [Brevundimonas denitrificans]